MLIKTLEVPIYDIIFNGDSNVCHICDHYRDICSRTAHGIDLDIYNGTRSNVNRKMERPYATFFLFALAMFSPSVIVCEIIAQELANVPDSNCDLENEGHGCWRSGWKLAAELLCQNVCACKKNGASRSSHLFEVHFVTDVRAFYLIGQYHSTPLERCKHYFELTSGWTSWQ